MDFNPRIFAVLVLAIICLCGGGWMLVTATATPIDSSSSDGLIIRANVDGAGKGEPVGIGLPADGDVSPVSVPRGFSLSCEFVGVDGGQMLIMSVDVRSFNLHYWGKRYLCYVSSD